MEWNEISKSRYHSVFENSWTVFHSASFNDLNKSKVDRVIYLHCLGEHAHYGIIFGEKEGELISPFSSPFGGIESKGNYSTSELNKVIHALVERIQNQYQLVRITLPPSCYGMEFIHSLNESFLSSGFSKMYTDINFHLDLSNDTEPESKMERNAKKNLRKGLAMPHSFFQALTEEDKLRAYSVIAKNRQEKGYPLKLSFQSLQETNIVVDIDFYLLECEGKDAAAAIVFRISQTVAMVVYWGHLNEFSDYRPINLLAYYLYKTYSKLGFQILDIGPSSEYGILNEGLGSFKDSLGCVRSEKITLSLTHA